LGGGRRLAEDKIDPSVGLTDLCMAGQEMTLDTPVATIHAASEADWLLAADRLKSAVRINQVRSEIPPAIYERIEGDKK